MTTSLSGHYLLDTHIILWAGLNPEKITESVKAAMSQPDASFYVSATSVAEIACGVERGRIRLPVHWKSWFRDAVDRNGWTCLPMTLDIMEEAYSLPGEFHPDPGDRVLVATARVERLTLLTADTKILAYPHVASRG
ncbi:MAG TPA: type II toxin-antitoxin system VapC family toxin [Fibrobacteria bacterium]|jgi:PIN domain nuclease of toxin-antitoxin system|nr:type II toxin-antitoxin system VapC family toxin [Fibrobacteria bacterium]